MSFTREHYGSPDHSSDTAKLDHLTVESKIQEYGHTVNEKCLYISALYVELSILMRRIVSLRIELRRVRAERDYSLDTEGASSKKYNSLTDVLDILDKDYISISETIAKVVKDISEIDNSSIIQSVNELVF